MVLWQLPAGGPHGAARRPPPLRPFRPPPAGVPGSPQGRREERAAPCERRAASGGPRGRQMGWETARGPAVSAASAPPRREPLLPAAVRSLPAGNHGVQRGGRKQQRLCGGEGERQEEEPGRPGYGLAHLLQHRHDRGVSGRRAGGGAAPRAGAERRGRSSSAWESGGSDRGAAGRGPGAPGSRGESGEPSPARHCLIRCSVTSSERVIPEPAAEVKYSRARNAGGGAARAAPTEPAPSTANRPRAAPRPPGGFQAPGAAAVAVSVPEGLRRSAGLAVCGPEPCGAETHTAVSLLWRSAPAVVAAAWGDSGWAAGARGLVWSARYCSAEGNGCLFGVKDDASVRVYIFSAWSRYFHFWNFVPLTNACHVCAEKPSVDFHFVARVRAHVACTCTCGRWLNT